MSFKIILLLVDVILLAATAGVLIWRIQRQNRLRSQARKRNAGFLGSGDDFDVGSLRSADLERPLTALLAVQPGTLVVGARGSRFVGVGPASGRDIRIEFDESTRVAMVPKPWYGIGVLPLVRLSNATGCYYFFARQKFARPSAAKTASLYQSLSKRFRPETKTLIEQKASPLSYAIAAIAMLGIIGAAADSVAFPLHSGPWAIAASESEGGVAATQQEILRFDSAGKLVQQVPYQAIGLAHAPAYLAVAPDGEMYAADVVAGSIYRCGKPEDLSCTPLPQAFPAAQRPRGAFKFAFNRDGSRLIVSIADQDALLVLDRDGRVLDSLDGAHSGLCFPNGLAFGADGNLYVADTNNFRIAEFALAQDSLHYVGEHSMAAERPAASGSECRSVHVRRYVPLHEPTAFAGARDGRAWPVTIAQSADGHWWVTLSTDMLDAADVAEFSSDWKSPTFYPLGERNDLTALAAWHGTVWATNNRLGIKVLESGKEPRTLADDGMKTFMRQVQADRVRVGLHRLAGTLGSLGILMVVLLGAFFANRRYLASVLRSEPTTAA